MSEKEAYHLKVIISVLMILIGICLSFAMEIKVSSWWMATVTFFLVSAAFTLIGLHGYWGGCGRFATEINLDSDIAYSIREVVNLKDGTTLFILGANIYYKTQVVEEPYGGFKKFDVVDGKYLVPKKLNAKLVDGQLLISF